MSALSRLFSVHEPTPPDAAVAIASSGISGAVIDVGGSRASVRAFAIEPLPADALVPSLTLANIRDRGAVEAALSRVLDRIGRPSRVGLVLPDAVAKVSLIRFEQVPNRARDLDQLIRWQLRKAAPFPIEDAQVAFVPAARHPDGQEFVVSVARRETVKEYEDLCVRAGAQAGLIDISTFNVINAVLAGWEPAGADWLLVNVASDGLSAAIMRGTELMFFRSRGSESEGTLVDLVHQTAMYYEDRLKGSGLLHVLVSGPAAAGQTAEQTRRSLEQRLGTNVSMVDVRQALTLTDRIDAPDDVLDRLAPLAGLLLRGQGAAE